jgi:outer membrane protein OmpA-like peptidoglycan-associated protein
MGVSEIRPKESAMFRYLSTIALAFAAAWFTPAARAEKVMVYREGQLVNPQDVADVLGRKTRSIILLEETAPSSATAAAKTPARPGRAAAEADGAPSALSLPVRFAFDSAEIQPSARTQLDALAEGIKLLAPGRIVTVEGHTDATGTDDYNRELSRSRAQAVRDYLVRHHGIAAERLKTVAYGEGRPLEGSDPHASVNRRVQFRGS